MGYALITGASAGLGADFARLFVRDGHSVILVARRKENLENLASELHKINNKTSVIIHAQDLGRPGAGQELHTWTKQQQLPIDYLINNAGFGEVGPFSKLSLSQQLKMIDLNVRTLVELCHLFSQDMIAKKNGKILNVGSMAGFQPGPYMSTYYASKAFVNSFSEALSHELEGTGVTCTVLAPGPVATEFARVAGYANARLFNSKLVATSVQVAQEGYDAMLKGASLLVPGLVNKLLLQGNRFVPRSLAKKIAASLNRS